MLKADFISSYEAYGRAVVDIEAFDPDPKIRKDGRGRPWRGNREVLEGILWVLRNGCSWSSLPAEYPPYQTCHRRFQQWQKQGVWDKLLKSIARQMERDGSLDLTESFMGWQFFCGKKRGDKVGKTKKGKGSKVMALTDGQGLPISVDVTSASPHESKLAEETFNKSRFQEILKD
jgi:transposase